MGKQKNRGKSQKTEDKEREAAVRSERGRKLSVGAETKAKEKLEGERPGGAATFRQNPPLSSTNLHRERSL